MGRIDAAATTWMNPGLDITGRSRRRRGYGVDRLWGGRLQKSAVASPPDESTSRPDLDDAENWDGCLISSTSRLMLPIDELYKPFLMSAKERRQRSRGGKRVSLAGEDRPGTRAGTAVSQSRDASGDPLSPGDQESIDTLHGRHRRATVPRAMP